MRGGTESTPRTKEDVLSFLRRAWLQGRPIVPLLGAGVSVGSAIPVTSQLVEYLVKVKCVSTDAKWPDSGEYLRVHGWPPRHQLNVELRARGMDSERLRTAKLDLFREALESELGPRVPTAHSVLGRLYEAERDRAEARARTPLEEGKKHNDAKIAMADSNMAKSLRWTALLQAITGRKQGLIDAFFDRLVRERRPSDAHRFIAFLTKLANWELILTTNFDDLVECALRDEGLAPVIYELVSDRAMPDPRLLESHLAIIKMNGGAFGLRAGFELDEPLDPQSVAFFHQYLPRNVVLLVLGYGGGHERRVLTILESLAEAFEKDGKNNRGRIVWVNPNPEIELRNRYINQSIWRLQHSDAGLFLQEMYEYMSFSHAVSAQPYDALHMLPEVSFAGEPRTAMPSFSGVDTDTKERALRAELRRRYEEGNFTGDKSSDIPYERLWFNLYELPTVATFMEVLLESIRRSDRSLPPLILSPVIDFQSFAKLETMAESARTRAYERRRDCYRYIATALRRYRYFIAIDGVRPFWNFHPAACLGIPKIHRDRFEQQTDVPRKGRRELLCFWRELRDFVRTDDSLGESRLLLAFEDAGELIREELPKDPLRVVRIDEQAPLVLSEAVRSPDQWYIELRKENGDDAVAKARVAEVAVSFRRPRSRVALTRIASKSLKDELREKRPPADPLRRVLGELAFWGRKVEDAISSLEKEGFFFAQDGGFFSMGTELRNELFKRFESDEARTDRMHKFQSHIADYYRVNVYQQSQDLAAYVEYVFHRMASMEIGRRSPFGPPGKWLIASLKREGALLSGRGYASAMIAVLDDLEGRITSSNDSGEGDVPVGEEPQDALDELAEMKARIRRDMTDFDGTATYYVTSARCKLTKLTKLLEDMKQLPKPAYSAGDPRSELLLLRISLGETFFDLASCANRRHVDVGEATDDQKTLDDLIRDVPPELQKSVLTTEAADSMRAGPLVDPSPNDLADLALKIVAKCAEDIEKHPDPNFRREIEKRSQPLYVRCLRACIEYKMRDSNPWDSGPYAGTKATRAVGTRPSEAAQASEGVQPSEPQKDPSEQLFDIGIDILRQHGRGETGLELQSRLRCARARKLYLAGSYGHANMELNRAHGFAARTKSADAPLTQAIYSLHRAEYCILFAREFKKSPMKGSLLKAARGQLKQAEDLLLRARRDVFWWCRLFLLRARLGCEQLRVSCDEIHRTASRSKSGGPRRFVDDDALRDEAALLAALQAIAGGLANIHNNERRRRLLHDAWDDLERLHRRRFFELVHVVSTDLRDPHRPFSASVAVDWETYNRRAGLDFYHDRRKSRRAVGDGLKVECKETIAGIARPIDVGERGIGIRFDTSESSIPTLIDLDIEGLDERLNVRAQRVRVASKSSEAHGYCWIAWRRDGSTIRPATREREPRSGSELRDALQRMLARIKPLVRVRPG
jgi:hypothetical protein